MDRISVVGLRVWAYHGVLAFEQELGQEFLIDVHLDVDLSSAGASDQLADTIDYGDLASRVSTLARTTRFDLIETLASRVADEALMDGRVRLVEVTVHKPSAPLTVAAAEVAVTVRRGPAS